MYPHFIEWKALYYNNGFRCSGRSIASTVKKDQDKKEACHLLLLNKILKVFASTEIDLRKFAF